MIDEELAKKGLMKTDSDNADLYIGYQTAPSRQTPWKAYHNDWGYRPGWGGAATAAAAKEKRLVWRGAVSNAVEIKLNPDKSEKKIEKSVEKLLKNYPPRKQ
jgi:hypothetical protein